MFLAMSRHLLSSEGPHIDRISMDGRGEHTHIVESSLEGPTLNLHFDNDMGRIFWADPNNGEISSAAANGMEIVTFTTKERKSLQMWKLEQLHNYSYESCRRLKKIPLECAGSDGRMSASGSAGPGFDPRRSSKFSFKNFQPLG